MCFYTENALFAEKAVIKCPDGAIGWQGVLMTATASHDYAASNYYCAAWDSLAARLGLQDCTPDGRICTKIMARHLHKMKKSAGVLMMKRIKCDNSSCSVFKVAL